LSDHYNPLKKTINLSHDVYAGASVAALLLQPTKQATPFSMQVVCMAEHEIEAYSRGELCIQWISGC
jgi:hypothetical protein